MRAHLFGLFPFRRALLVTHSLSILFACFGTEAHAGASVCHSIQWAKENIETHTKWKAEYAECNPEKLARAFGLASRQKSFNCHLLAEQENLQIYLGEKKLEALEDRRKKEKVTCS